MPKELSKRASSGPIGSGVIAYEKTRFSAPFVTPQEAPKLASELLSTSNVRIDASTLAKVRGPANRGRTLQLKWAAPELAIKDPIDVSVLPRNRFLNPLPISPGAGIKSTYEKEPWRNTFEAKVGKKPRLALVPRDNAATASTNWLAKHKRMQRSAPGASTRQEGAGSRDDLSMISATAESEPDQAPSALDAAFAAACRKREAAEQAAIANAFAGAVHAKVADEKEVTETRQRAESGDGWAMHEIGRAHV